MTKVNNYLNTIIKSAGIVFLGLIFGKLFSYLYVIILAKLGSSNYGLITLAFTIISFLSILTLLGLKSALIRYVAFYKAKKNIKKIKGTVYSSIIISLSFSLFVSILLFIFSKEIALRLFHNQDLTILLKILAFVIPIRSLSRIFLTTLQAFQKIKEVTITEQIIENVLKLIITFVLIALGFKSIGAVFAFIIVSLITLFLAIYFVNKNIHFLLNKKIKNLYNYKELIIFGLPLLFSDFLVNITKWLDTWFLGFFRTTSEVGLYNVVLPTANLLVLIPTALMTLFTPIITELYAKNKMKQIKNISKFVSKWIFFINLPIAVFLMIFSKQILAIMFGGEYIVSYAAMIILVIGYIPYSLSHINANILQTIKKTNLIFLIFLIATVLNIVLNIILIPRYGIVGAAITSSLYLITLYLLMSYFVFKYKRIQFVKLEYLKSIISILFASLITIRLATIIKPNSIISLIILSIILFIIYCLFIVLLKGINKDDIAIFNGLKKDIFKNYF